LERRSRGFGDFGGRGTVHERISRPADQVKRDSTGRAIIQRTKFSLMLFGMHPDDTWADLKNWCKKHGEVTFTNKHQGDTLGIATFSNRECMLHVKKVLEREQPFGRDVKIKFEFPEVCDENYRGSISNDISDRPGYDPNYKRNSRYNRSPSPRRRRSPIGPRGRSRSAHRSISRSPSPQFKSRSQSPSERKEKKVSSTVNSDEEDDDLNALRK